MKGGTIKPKIPDLFSYLHGSGPGAIFHRPLKEKLRVFIVYNILILAWVCIGNSLTYPIAKKLFPDSYRALLTTASLTIVMGSLIGMLPLLISGMKRRWGVVVIAITLLMALSIGLYIGLNLESLPDLEGITWYSITTGSAAVVLFILFLVMYTSLLKKSVEEKSALEAEIKYAHLLQAQLIPSTEISFSNYRFFGQTKQANKIGGDFFDIIQLSPGKIIIAIGDVSGHNFAAGLLMAIVKGAFHTEIRYLSDLETLCASLNQTVVENSDKRMFVGFTCVLLDYESRKLTMVNAGHLPMMRINGATGEIEDYLPKGMAFGLSKSATFGSHTLEFAAGDVFALYTDGLIEGTNASGEQFGTERLRELLRSHAGESPKALFDNVISDFEAFHQSDKNEDDVTFISLKVL
ncbi:MAG: serine/threonine-protein phosphatase [bacterium]|nr:serine/threonine-protein phosphatase [bacterium]